MQQQKCLRLFANTVAEGRMRQQIVCVHALQRGRAGIWSARE
jgi:hypothetical protein